VQYPLVLLILERQRLPLQSPLGDVDWWLKGELTRLFVNQKFNADEAETLFFTTSRYCKNKNFLLFGTGSVVEFSSVKGEHLLEILKNQLSSLNVRNFLLVPSNKIFPNIPSIKKHLASFSIDLCV